MTPDRWLYAWAVGSVAFGGASLLVPLYVLALGVVLATSIAGITATTLAVLGIGVSWAIIAVTGGTIVTRFTPPVAHGEGLEMDAALSALAGGPGTIFGGSLAGVGYLVAFDGAGGLVVFGASLVAVVHLAVSRKTARS